MGKAKNLRRRLQGYRNAGRTKRERKMLLLINEAQRIEFELLATEEEALLRENQLIIDHQPTYNVQSAYHFLYPALGVGTWDAHLLLCFTTQPNEYQELDLNWYGVFRSRPRAQIAFEALCELLSVVGHREQSNRLPAHQNPRGSRLKGWRQVPLDLKETLPWFLAGGELDFLTLLSRALLEKPYARRHSEAMQEKLRVLKIFYELDAQKLKEELAAVGRPGSFIPGTQRDALSIRAQFIR